MPQLRSKRNLSCVKHKAAFKQTLLLVKSPFSPINTGASSYRISSNSRCVDGRMTGNEFANYTYDAASRITGITQNLWASRTVTQVIGTGTAVVTQTYLTPLTWQASYDRRNRVTGFNRDGASTGFTYDANSNRLTSIDKTTSDTDLDDDYVQADLLQTSSQTSAVDAASNKLLGFSQTLTKVRGTKTLATTNSAVNYALDANGNLLSDGLRSFAYDEANRLSKVKITKDGEAASIAYLHNALGQRVFKGELKADAKRPNASTLSESHIDWLKENFKRLFETEDDDTRVGTAYSFADEQLPSWALLGDYDNGSAKGAGRSEYIWLPTEDGSATPVGMYRNSKFFALHSDHLGTPRLVTSDTNTPVWQWPYSAFGNNRPTGVLKAKANPKGVLTNNPVLLRATNATEFNLRFPGQYADDEAGNFYNLHREYLAGQGRYTQNDPIGLAGGLNTYAYANGAPLMYTDPLGLFGMADMPTAPQGVVDFGAGLGDALLLGTGSYLRDAAGVDGGVDECSDAYLYGGLSSAAFGGARLAYAGLAKAGSVVATSGAAASEFRQTLKVVFRGGVGRNWRPPNLAGKSDAALRQSAGKTNAAINSYGAGTAAAAGIDASKCGCPR